MYVNVASGEEISCVRTCQSTLEIHVQRVLSNSSFLGEISPLLARNERLFGCVIRGFRGEYTEQNCERNERRDKYFYFLSSSLSLSL